MKLLLIPSDYEAAPILKKLKRRRRRRYPSGLVMHEGVWAGKPLRVGVIGMGMPHCAKRAAEAMDSARPEQVILAGFCGALSETFEEGEIFLTTTPDDDLPTPWMHAALHTTQNVVSGSEAKMQLHKDTGDDCVDMEQSFVEPLAEERGIPFLGVRIVSDTVDADVPSEALARAYDQKNGKTTPLRMAFYLMGHPAQIARLVRFLKPLDAIRNKLAEELLEFIETPQENA